MKGPLVCKVCSMLLIPVLKWWRSSFSAWAAMMGWNIATRQSPIPEADLLQLNLSDKTGEKGKWNFEKAHSIQSWQSGLGRTCRMSWVLPTKQISELQLVECCLALFRLDSCGAEQYPASSCSRQCLDNLWMRGMGVRFFQGHYACQMLSL